MNGTIFLDRPARWRTPVAAIAVALIAGCASAEKQVYVDWIAISNPEAVCKGADGCVQHSTYRGKPLCTIVTADRNLSYARLGERVRECAQ